MNIDFNIFDFVDILYIVLVPIAVMVLVTFWLRRRQRSRAMILATWAGFTFIVFVGLTCLLISIQSARTYWLNYFAEMAAAYSVVVSKLDHWKIVAGDENVFSEWSAPVTPTEAPKKRTTDDTTSMAAEWVPNTRLSVPEHFTATRLSPSPTAPSQVSLRWSAVPGATTYRVQWAETETAGDEDWEAVYSGAARECLIDDSGSGHVFRIRAETGTPEDDPTYRALLEACDDATTVSRYIGSTYTMRGIEGEDACMFIICPATDNNNDGIIEAHERPAPIGEKYPNTAVMRYVFSRHEAGINTIPITDDWGTWVTAFHPLRDPQGNFDGAVGIDLDYALWSGNLTKAKIWPYSFFFILTILFFGSIYMIVLNQLASEASKLYAARLQESVLQLTEAKQAAEAAVRAKGHFLANMSHEIRTPMNAVLGFANIIGRKLMLRCLPEEREQCQEAVELITGSGNDLLTIINDILDFSKVESDQIEVESIPVSLHATMESIRTIMQERLDNKDHLSLDITDEGGVPELILSDPTRLRQILSNLIGNAIKFTERGTVAVRYGIEKDAVRKMLFVEVRDTGIGMSPEQLTRLFQPFSQADSTLTRRFGGTGLGLSISKRLAVLLGGDIRVASKADEGSVFTLVLPIREPDAEERAKWDSKLQKDAVYERSALSTPLDMTETKPLSGFSILVVEDGRVNQIVLSAQLTEAGSHVCLADNGQAAIESICAQESSGTPFDAVLMDMQMPIMDGYEATRQLRKQGYTRPIIAITAHALSGDCEKTLEVGCNAYLSKPIDREQLIRTILEITIDPRA